MARARPSGQRGCPAGAEHQVTAKLKSLAQTMPMTTRTERAAAERFLARWLIVVAASVVCCVVSRAPTLLAGFSNSGLSLAINVGHVVVFGPFAIAALVLWRDWSASRVALGAGGRGMGLAPNFLASRDGHRVPSYAAGHGDGARKCQMRNRERICAFYGISASSDRRRPVSRSFWGVAREPSPYALHLPTCTELDQYPTWPAYRLLRRTNLEAVGGIGGRTSHAGQGQDSTKEEEMKAVLRCMSLLVYGYAIYYGVSSARAQFFILNTRHEVDVKAGLDPETAKLLGSIADEINKAPENIKRAVCSFHTTVKSNYYK